MKVSVKHLNTFSVDVKVSELLILHHRDQLKHLDLKQSNLIIGEGSNLLFVSDLEIQLIKNELKGIELIRESDASVDVRVGAGENWHELVVWSLKHHLNGLENLSLIPGSVGAAPVQNIGAYGVELKDILHEVEALNLTNGECVTFSNSDCKFDYRDSLFKRQKDTWLILSVTLRLSKCPNINLSYKPLAKIIEHLSVENLTAKHISDAVINIRKQKLPNPNELGNAGSFFKNPVVSLSKYELLLKDFPDLIAFPFEEQKIKLAAGWLVEACGWKGKRVGDAGVHKNQALVLVNYGKASGEEIYVLSKQIQNSVFKQFSIHLEPEVRILGSFKE